MDATDDAAQCRREIYVLRTQLRKAAQVRLKTPPGADAAMPHETRPPMNAIVRHEALPQMDTTMIHETLPQINATMIHDTRPQMNATTNAAMSTDEHHHAPTRHVTAPQDAAADVPCRR